MDLLPVKNCSVRTQDTPIDLRRCNNLIWNAKPGQTSLRCKVNKVTSVVLACVEIELTLSYLEIFKLICISRGKRLLASSSLFVRLSTFISAACTGWIFVKFCICDFY